MGVHQSERIRPARVADLAGVEALSYQWSDEGVTWGLAPTPASLLRERVGPCFLVAGAADDLVGYAFGRTRPSTDQAVFPSGATVFELEEIYVTPPLRRQGIGGALLVAVLTAARANGVKHFLVYSATKPIEIAMHFYASHGFLPWYVQMFRSE